jgi:methyltransferase family protein
MEPDPDNVGEYLISARSYEEYRAMFALTDNDLTGSILDCPGGGSSFTARANANGATAIATDPVYATPREILAKHVIAETDRGSAHTAAGSDRYVWDFYVDLAGHARIRRDSAELFAHDLIAHPLRYVAASLPNLPFADGQFDLVLSSHFLFTYADRLDAEFHRNALRELYRVSRGEVRVFPLLEQGGRPLAALLDDLRANLGIPYTVRRVGYEFQRGGNEMLVLTH